MDRIKVSALFKPLVLPTGLAAFTAMAIESASAHDKGCDDDPAPVTIKLDCCGRLTSIS